MNYFLESSIEKSLVARYARLRSDISQLDIMREFSMYEIKHTKLDDLDIEQGSALEIIAECKAWQGVLSSDEHIADFMAYRFTDGTRLSALFDLSGSEFKKFCDKLYDTYKILGEEYFSTLDYYTKLAISVIGGINDSDETLWDIDLSNLTTSNLVGSVSEERLICEIGQYCRKFDFKKENDMINFAEVEKIWQKAVDKNFKNYEAAFHTFQKSLEALVLKWKNAFLTRHCNILDFFKEGGVDMTKELRRAVEKAFLITDEEYCKMLKAAHIEGVNFNR